MRMLRDAAFSVVLTICTCASAAAQMQLFDGFDEMDPVGSAVIELHSRLARS